VFCAYFDDSAMQGESPSVLSMACYASSDKQWDQFEDQWRRRLLKPEGVSALRMIDLNNKFGEFKGWKPEREKRFIQRAHKIIDRCTIRGIAMTVDIAAYKKLLKPPSSHFFCGPYGFCVFNCLLQLRHNMRRWLPRRFPFRNPMACAFERKTGYGDEINCLMDNIARHYAVETDLAVTSHSFVDKIERPGLQAADVLVYESSKHWFNEFFEKKNRSTRKSLLNLYRHRDFGYYYEHEGLVKYLEAFEVPSDPTGHSL
jgi:hypothetical protein